MSTEARIVAGISPELEYRLLTYNISSDVVELFIRALSIFSRLKHVTILIVPKHLTAVFKSHDKLKIFISAVESDSQSNIIFATHNIPPQCNLTHEDILFPPFPSSINSRDFIVNTISKDRAPFLICTKSNAIKKEKCPRPCVNTICPDEVLLLTSNLPNLSDFDRLLKETIKSNLKLIYIKKDSIKLQDIKFLSFILSVLHNFTDDEIKLSTDYHLHKSIYTDIKEGSIDDYIDIAFSMSRSILFSSASNPNQERSRYSIDWHPHNPNKINNYKIFRVDVVPSDRSGKTNSGVKRLLIADDGKKKTFIAYTSRHDFSIDLIRKRIETLSSEIFLE
jgi:hypothetical protein